MTEQCQKMAKLYVPEREAGRITGYSVHSLRNWRHLGEGPDYIKKGRTVRYYIPDLLDWMEAGRVQQVAR